MDSRTAPLAKLYISQSNVRKTDRDLDVGPLAANIAAHGLIEPLVVVDEGKGRGRLGVIAGGRRLLALQLLAQGDWPADKIDRGAIPISVRSAAEAREISLSENTHTVVMNVADEVEAYAAIVADYEAQGEPDPDVRIARCARHFGKTERYVEQRLRLAGLLPEILDALRSARISIEVAKAYAFASDRSVQRELFTAQEKQGQHRVSAIREAIAGRTYRVGDRQVRYVGMQAYLDAGGRIDRDLFMGSEADEIVLDTALLDRLATEKGEAEARTIAAEAGYAGAVLKSWGGGSFLWPRTPDGFQRVFSLAGLEPEERGGAIVICAIAADGARVDLTDEGFKPAVAPVPAESGPGAHAAGRDARAVPRFLTTGESDLERLARIRRERIEATAVRLAVPSFEGTNFEGRTFWPPEGESRIPAIQQDAEFYAVAVYVKVPKSDVGRRMSYAEQLVDQDFGGPSARPSRAEEPEDWPEDGRREPAVAS